MTTDYPSYPTRTCPFPGCRAIWLEDPNMYHDVDRCPHCGRYADDFEYGCPPELCIPGGTNLERLRLVTESGIFLVTEETGRRWMVTEQFLDPAIFRR